MSSGEKKETPPSGESQQHQDRNLPLAHLAHDSTQVLQYIEQLKDYDINKDKTILVAVDFSAHSKAALLEAAQFAQLMQAPLVVLHVIHDPAEMPGYYTKFVKNKKIIQIHKIAGEIFYDFVQQALADNPQLDKLRQAEKLMVTGLPVTRILEVIDLIHPRLLVVGSQGRSTLNQLLIGSKAAQLIQMSPVSVTIVKLPAPVNQEMEQEHSLAADEK